MCIERCKHGSGGGAGASSKEASRVYPTETGLRGSVQPQPWGGIERGPKAAANQDGKRIAP